MKPQFQHSDPWAHEPVQKVSSAATQSSNDTRFASLDDPEDFRGARGNLPMLGAALIGILGIFAAVAAMLFGSYHLAMMVRPAVLNTLDKVMADPFPWLVFGGVAAFSSIALFLLWYMSARRSAAADADFGDSE